MEGGSEAPRDAKADAEAGWTLIGIRDLETVDDCKVGTWVVCLTFAGLAELENSALPGP